MHSRRIACLLLGLWLGAGLWTQWMASQNLASPDLMMRRPSPQASAYLKTLGLPQAVPLAHYLAAEQNRLLYEGWGNVQIVLAAGLLFLLVFATRMGKLPLALALTLLLIAIGERVALTPGMEMVGRATDFSANPSHRAQLAMEAVSYGYNVTETLKWMVALVAAAVLIWQRSPRSLNSLDQIDVIDKADYRHINR